LGILRQLEATQAMRLKLVSVPNALDRPQADANRLGDGAPGPVCRVASASEQGSASTFATVSGDSGALPGLRILSRSSPSTPCSA
jgi:hypothetical protein